MAGMYHYGDNSCPGAYCVFGKKFHTQEVYQQVLYTGLKMRNVEKQNPEVAPFEAMEASLS